MTIVKRNLAANLTGAVWTAIISVVMVPVYIRLLGIEAFGLIGFQGALHAIVTLFDLGLSTTLNRELARWSATDARRDRIGTITRTGETLYWTIIVTVGAVLFAAAPMLATRWLDTGHYDAATVVAVLRYAVVCVVIQVPYAFYAAGLLGLQRHVVLNGILCTAATLRAGGAVILLTFVRADVRMLFAWFIVAAAFQTLAAAVALRRATSPRRQFDLASLAHAWRFAAGVAAAGIIAALTGQIDKLAASRLLPLREFGHYSLAGAAAGLVALIVTPVQSTVFPRISQLVAASDNEETALIYHRACQTLSTLLLPLATVIAFFSTELVLVWTQDPAIAREARWPVALLVVGAALNALSHISHSVQLAHGWTAPALVANVVQLIVMVPLTIGAIRWMGATGAALAWLVLQLSFLVISLTVTHRRTLRNDFGRWLVEDVSAPLLAAVTVVALAKLVVHAESRLVLLISIGLVGIVAMLAAGLATPVTRGWLGEQWRRLALGLTR